MVIHIPQNFYRQTVAQDWSTGTGNFYVSVKPTVSEGYMTISPASSTLREIVYFSATGTDGTGDYITISNASDRGIGGTTEQTHIIGETCRMNVSAETIQEISDDIDAIVAAGAVDATTTSKGLVEEATLAEAIAGTAIGSTGARLFLNPSTSGTKFSTTEVFNGTAPTSYTDLDLSSVVGVAQRVVMLRVHTGGGSGYYIFRPNGTSYTQDDGSSTAFGVSRTKAIGSFSAVIIVKTDASGVIEWIGNTGSVSIEVMAYW